MKSRHTEFFAEYLENGGVLPAAFELIPALNEIPFEDLFVEHFFEREIGFETEVLFGAKLEHRANIVCPYYAKIIASFGDKDLLTGDNRRIELSRDNKTLTSMFTNPINTTVTEPPVGNLTGQNEIKTDDGETTAFSGMSTDEQIQAFDKLKDGVRGIYALLLDAFESCFMGVF